MNVSLSEALKEAYTVATNDATVDTIQLSHPSLSGSVYLVADTQNRSFTLEDGETTVVFKACAIDFTLPGTEAEMTLTICNVDRSIAEFVEVAAGFPAPVEVTFRPYRLAEPDYPAMDPPLTMFLNEASVELMSVTGRATFANILNKKWPKQTEYYNEVRFPGI